MVMDMTLESAGWFVGQIVAIIAAALAGWWVGRREMRLWRPIAIAATVAMLTWPLMRLFPAHVIRWLGAQSVMFIEVTGIVIPAVLLFAIAARNIRTAGQRRAILLLIPVCCLYFVRNGVWMVRPPLDDLGPMQIQDGICRQSTGYTCVAASLVTLLDRHGYQASETQMARLSYTEAGWGTTDSRALVALHKRLAGEPVEICYEVMDYHRLTLVPKPCVVPIRWSYFVSHMVPILAANDEAVVIADPLDGVCEKSPEEFLEVWHKRGIYLIDHRVGAEAKR